MLSALSSQLSALSSRFAFRGALLIILLIPVALPIFIFEPANAEDDWFELKYIVDPIDGEGYRWVLDNPFEQDQASNFVCLGVYGLYGAGFRDGQAYPELLWGEYQRGSEAESREAWLSDQVKFMFKNNINILGPKGSFYPGETKWFDKNARKRYDYEDCECKDTPAPVYKNKEAGPSVNLHKIINEYITSYHNADPSVYPRPYFPYMAYVYITTPTFEADLTAREGTVMPGWHMVPDLWHDLFWDEAMLKAFLVLSDGVEIEDRWAYSNVAIDAPYVSFHGGPDETEPVLVVPGHWKCHRPAGLFNKKQVVAVSLGYDVPWKWRTPEASWDHIMYQRTWIRALLAQKYRPDPPNPVPYGYKPIPPARTAFVEAMIEQVGINNIAAWNDKYPDFAVSYWYLADDPAPEPDPEDNLETRDLTGGYGGESDYFRFSEDCFPGEEPGSEYDSFGDWLRHYEDPRDPDLGEILLTDDAEYFTLKMSEKYHETAIDAIRFFDPNHLIFSECDNWLAGSHPTKYKPVYQLNQILHSEGEFNEEPGDKISAIVSQIYPNVPERGVEYPPDIDLISYHSRANEFVNIQLTLLDEGKISTPFPVLVGSFTLNANWEKGWSYNWEEGGEQNCPIQGEPRVDQDWLKFAPVPHGWDNNEKECLNPKKYGRSSTETGLLRNWDDDDFHNGRGDDYKIVTSSLTEDIEYEGDNFIFFIGAVWHDYYDNGLDDGEGTQASSNWGFVNSMEPLWCDCPQGDCPQYKQLHEKAQNRAGSIQKWISGESWSKQGEFPDPPETHDDFGQYEIE